MAEYCCEQPMKLFWVWPGSLPEQTASSVLATGHFIEYTMPTFILLNQPYIWLKMTSSEIAEPASLLLATGSPTGAPNVVACRLTGHICTVGHLRKTTVWVDQWVSVVPWQHCNSQDSPLWLLSHRWRSRAPLSPVQTPSAASLVSAAEGRFSN